MVSETSLERSGSSAKKPVGSSLATDSYIEALNVLVTLLENARPDLRGHTAHVARLTRKTAEKIGLPATGVESIVIAAFLHDLGKMSTYHLTALNVAEYEGHRVAAQKAYLTPRRLFESVVMSPDTVSTIEQLYERFDG
jgi:response regulator RpfG family c-di-GMP phosphodiesterase